jgi:heat shock transcription factor
LINKPKSGNKKNKDKKGEEIDSDDDGLVEEPYTQPSFPTTSNQLNLTDVGQLPPKKDLVLVKTQLEKLQQQQVAISQLIERLRREHAQLMTQAAVFQNQHERHENSINAILNFLANVFRKSLEEQGGAQSVSELLASIIPGAQSQMPQGSVVDLGDFDAQRPQETQDMNAPKRQQRLLPPIPVQAKASTLSPSTIEATTPQSHYEVPMGSVTELFDGSEPSTPAYIKNELQTNPHEGMMKIINETNASGGSSRLDLPDMASKTNATMSHEQRNKMLNMMAGRTSSPGLPKNPSAPASASSSAQQPASSMPSTNNGLSPILSSAPPPSMYQMQNTQAEIDALQQMQRDQAAKIQELSSILGPLSPLRHIQNLDDDAANGYFDSGIGGGLDEFIDPNAFAEMASYNDIGAPTTAGTDGNDFNFGLDGDGGDPGLDFGGVAGLGAGAYGPTETQTTPSSAGTEEIQRDDLGSPGSKRRRVQ